MSEQQSSSLEFVKCSRCERSILKTAVIQVEGKYYCCPDCAQNKTCDCQ